MPDDTSTHNPGTPKADGSAHQQGETVNADDQRPDLRPHDLEDVAHLAGMSAVACYIIGMLTANTYLYGLEVSDFSLLRTRFVLTGVLSSLPIVISSLFLIRGMRVWLGAPAFHVAPTKGIIYRLFGIFVSFILPVLLYDVALATLTNRGISVHVRTSLILWTLSVLPLIFLVILERIGARLVQDAVILFPVGSHYPDRAKSRGSKALASLSQRFIIGISFLFLNLLFVGYFADVIFPRVPEQFGGARPKAAQFLFKEDAIEMIRPLYLSVSEAKPLSAPVTVLWEGDESYIIRLPRAQGSQVVQLRKEWIGGIIVGGKVPLAPPAPVIASP